MRRRNLPPCVYHKHGAYWYVKRQKWTRLGADLGQALTAYARIVSPSASRMDRLIDDALGSLTVSKSTANQYRLAGNKLKKMLAEFSPEQVEGKHVAGIKRLMAKTPNMANRTLSVLRIVFGYAVEMQIVGNNPALGIKPFKENKRTRLLTEDEQAAIYEKAGPRLQVIMDLLRLTGQRVTDVLKIRRQDLRDEGIYFRQQKTDAELIVGWTPELRAAVERAKSLHGNVKALTLLHGRTGRAPDYSSVKAQWDVARRAAGVLDATMRDLRAVAATEAKRQGKDATALLGHANPAMTKRYLRGREIPVVESPNVRQSLNVRHSGKENQ